MPLAQITGSALFYEETPGKKTPVLFFHAFPLGLEMWKPQIEVLASRGHRTVAFDVRGFGRTGPASRTTAMSLIADDGASLMRHLGFERAVVCGCSMGGYAAFEFARRHSPWLAGLVLSDTKAGADTFEAKENREKFARTAMEKGVEWVASEMAPKLLKADPDPAVDATVRRLIRAATPEGVAAAQRGMAARADSNDLLPAINVPTLVIVGEEDKLTPPAEAEAMAKAIPGATLVKVPNAGHLPNLENPVAFNQALLTFLSRLD